MTSDPVKVDVPMKRYTTFRIGGPARILVEPANAESLAALVRFISRSGAPIYLLGGGSNLLVADDGIDGVVVYTRRGLAWIQEQEPGAEYTIVRAGAGLSLARLIRECADRGLGGPEALAGIPGSVGGAVVMNAGADSISTGDLVESITVCNREGAIFSLSREECEFGYRTSIFQDTGSEWVVLEAWFCLRKSPGEHVREAATRKIERRRRAQPYDMPSAGSVFRNPPGHSAGYLIDRAGWKGRSVGGASVSEEHANFIVNTGDARAADVLELVRSIQKSVLQQFGIALQLELKLWGVPAIDGAG